MPDDTARPEGTETWLLGALTQPVPPDETQGLIGIRELTKDELAKAQADIAFITAIAPLTPYARVMDALGDLHELVEQLVDHAGGRLSNNSRRRAARVLRGLAQALTQLPGALEETMSRQLGKDFEGAPAFEDFGEYSLAYLLACALDVIPPDQLDLVHHESVLDLAARPPGVRALSAATGIELPDQPFLVLSLAEDAVQYAARVVAHWLTALREPLREASLRVQALSAEVIEGHPAILKVIHRPTDEGGNDEVTNMTPQPLPLDEIRRAQASVHKSEDILRDEERKPALRAGPGLLTEQILSRVGWIVEPPDLFDVEDDEEDQEEDDEEELAAGVRPADLGALLRHVEEGAAKLEQAWSRALKEEELEELLGEWHSFVRALGAELAVRDSELTDDEARITWPPDVEDLEALVLDPEPAQAAHQARLAHFSALESLVAAMQGLERPTRYRVHPSEGLLQAWWSSGAFAAVRDRAELVRHLLALHERGRTGPPPAYLARESLHRAANAWGRGDPEATLLHSVRAIGACSEAGLSEGGQETVDSAAKLLELAREASRRLTAGRATDPGAVIVLAHATLESARQICADD